MGTPRRRSSITSSTFLVILFPSLLNNQNIRIDKPPSPDNVICGNIFPQYASRLQIWKFEKHSHFVSLQTLILYLHKFLFKEKKE